MGVPKGNGLVEINGSKSNESGRQCMRLIMFLSELDDKSWERWHDEHEKMRAGHCSFRGKCEIYRRTNKNINGNDIFRDAADEHIGSIQTEEEI